MALIRMSQVEIIMLGASLRQRGGIASVENLILKHIPPEVQIQHITSHDEGSIIHKVIVFNQAVMRFIKMLLFRHIDLVHIHLSERGSVIRKIILTTICFIFRKPVLMHTHGAEFHLFYDKLNSLAQKLICLIFRRCQGFIVLSKSWKEFYMNKVGLLEEKVFVLPNPVEIPFAVPRRNNKKKIRFVFMGRIGHRKGAFDLIKAFANLPAEQRRHSLLILAGDGDIECGQKLIENLNLMTKISLLGWIDPIKRNNLFAKCDVFMLPSYNEGLPMALLEAMGWGLPVITTPVGGVPEVVSSNENGLLVPPGDIQQLTEAMKLLIENETFRIRLGDAARTTAECFDVKVYCRSLTGIYHSIIQSTLFQGVLWQ